MQLVIGTVIIAGVFLLALFAAYPMPTHDEPDGLGKGGIRILTRTALYMILLFGALKILWPELL